MPYKQPDRAVEYIRSRSRDNSISSLPTSRTVFSARAVLQYTVEKWKGPLEEWQDVWDFFVNLTTHMNYYHFYLQSLHAIWVFGL